MFHLSAPREPTRLALSYRPRLSKDRPDVASTKGIAAKPRKILISISRTRRGLLPTLFVFPATQDSWNIVPTLSEHGISSDDTVLMVIPVEFAGHQAELVLQTTDRILSLIEPGRTTIKILRVQVRDSDIPGSTINLLKAMSRGEWNEVIMTLSDSISSSAVVMYLAGIVFSSQHKDQPQRKLRVFIFSRSAGTRVEVPVPKMPIPKSVSLLRILKTNPRARLMDIQPRMRRHPSTISRQIAAAERNGFVAENDFGYYLTPLGNVLVEVFADACEAE